MARSLIVPLSRASRPASSPVVQAEAVVTAMPLRTGWRPAGSSETSQRCRCPCCGKVVMLATLPPSSAVTAVTAAPLWTTPSCPQRLLPSSLAQVLVGGEPGVADRPPRGLVAHLPQQLIDLGCQVRGLVSCGVGGDEPRGDGDLVCELDADRDGIGAWAGFQPGLRDPLT